MKFSRFFYFTMVHRQSGSPPRTSSLKRFLALAGDFSVGRRSQGMGRAVLKVFKRKIVTTVIFLFRREDDHFSVLVDFQPVCPARRASSVCRQAENPPKLKSRHLHCEIKKITVVTIFLKLSKQLYLCLGYAFQLKNPQPMLEIYF